jgi:hypothetical protein
MATGVWRDRPRPRSRRGSALSRARAPWPVLVRGGGRTATGRARPSGHVGPRGRPWVLRGSMSGRRAVTQKRQTAKDDLRSCTGTDRLCGGPAHQATGFAGVSDYILQLGGQGIGILVQEGKQMRSIPEHVGACHDTVIHQDFLHKDAILESVTIAPFRGRGIPL